MKMDRRTFLSTAALAGGAAALTGLMGCSSPQPAQTAKAEAADEPQMASKATEAPGQSSQELEADVVVVGAGGAGLCAALTAREEGASVILLEAMPMTGGATLGSTATNVAGSQMQKDAGIEDTPESILASYVDDIADENVLATAKMYADNNGATFDWLQQKMGVKFADEVQFFPPYPVARIVYPIGAGPGVVATLTEKVEASDIQLLLETTATELVKENGAVVGLLAEGADGTEYRIAAKAVILAAGGFAANTAMVPYQQIKNAIYYGASSSDGKAMPLALKAGAQLLDLGVVPLDAGGLELAPGYGTQLYSVTMLTYKQSPAILVGADGKRFVNETAANPLLVRAQLPLPDSTAYLFMDKAAFDVFYKMGTRETGGVFTAEQMEKWLEKGETELPMIVTADTVEAVAAKAKIDGAALQQTIDAFNADAASGVDSQFERQITAPIEEGPYYIAKQNLRYAHSFGGLVANESLQVLDWTGTPIPGLYAAGQVLRSIQGQASKSSTSTSFAYTSGRVAAMNCTKEI